MVRNNGLVRLALLAAVVVIIVLVVYIWNIKSTTSIDGKNVSGNDDVNYVDLNELMGNNSANDTGSNTVNTDGNGNAMESGDATTGVANSGNNDNPDNANPTSVGSESTNPATDNGTEDANLKVVIVKEGDIVSFPNLKAVDPDDDKIKWSFSKPLNEEGTWETKKGDAGTYQVIITASDGKDSSTQNVMIIVEATNSVPVIEIASSFDFKEGDTVVLNPKVTDSDGDAVEITYSGFMDSNKKALSYADSGEHTVKITATDGKDTVSKNVKINVANVNRAPVITNVI